MDEKKLALGLKKRSRGALEKAIAVFTPYVSTVVWRALGEHCVREDLEEVVSDVFLSLWAHGETLDPAQGLRPWLGTVARNKAVDRLRRPPSPLPLEEDVPDRRATPEDEALQRDRAQALWRAVEALGEPDATLFLLHYYYGDKLTDAARALGLTPGAAKARLSRGRKALKKILTKGGERE